ncbi:MAG: hypothetical protein ACYS76_06080 [Planctomycetota bacterium]|jgi:hypothetical protein
MKRVIFLNCLLLTLGSASAAQAVTLFFENSGIEAGITVEGATDFTVAGSTWSGGVVGVPGVGPLYASPTHSYIIDPLGPGGVVTFDVPVDSVIFYFAHRASGDDALAGAALAFDKVNGGDFLGGVSSVLTTEVADANGFVTLDPNDGIRRIEFTGAVIDDFNFVPLPPPGPEFVAFDVRPGSCPNPLNTTSQGVLPVAVLGTAGFDVADIDVASVMLEGVSPIRYAHEDVAAPFEGQTCACHEVGPDGFMDLTLKFYTQEIVAAIGSVSDGQQVVLTLTGELFDGTPIESGDCVWVKHKEDSHPDEDSDADEDDEDSDTDEDDKDSNDDEDDEDPDTDEDPDADEDYRPARRWDRSGNRRRR